MPFRSKSQARWIRAAEARGEVPQGTSDRWAKETPNIKNRREKVKQPAKKKRKK